MMSNLPNWIENNKGTAKAIAIFILLLAGLASALGLGEIRHLKTQYSLKQFVPDNHPLILKELDIKKTFKLSDEQPIVVAVSLKPKTQGTWLDPERMAKVREATEIFSKIEGIEKVTSLSNVKAAETTKSGIEVKDLFSFLPQDQWHKRVYEDALLTSGLISKDLRTIGIFGDIGVLSLEKVATMVAELKKNLAPVFSDKDLDVYVSGVVPLQAELTTLIASELNRFLLFAFVACLITLVAYFRSFSTVIACLLLVLISNIAALAWMSFMGFAFSVMSTTVPLLASIAALAIGSHTLLSVCYSWRQQVTAGKNPTKVEVVVHVYRDLFLPNLLMALTTSIGFSAMIWSGAPLIREFGMSVCGGILLSWLSIVLVLPAMLMFIPIPEARRWTDAKATWIQPILKYYKWIIGGTAAFAAIAVIQGLDLNWSVRLYDDLPKLPHIWNAANTIDQKLGGMIPLDIMVTIPNEGEPWNDPANIAKLKTILEKVRKIPDVGSAIGLPDFLRTGIGGEKVDSRQAVAELAFLYSMSGSSNPLTYFLSNSGNATRLSIRFKDIPSFEMREMAGEIEREVRKEFEKATVNSGGMAVTNHQVWEELSRSLVSGIWDSLFWISLLLVFVFRSVRMTIVAALPNLLPPLVLLFTMSVLKTPVKPIVGVIFSIALGIAYNNTVYLVMRLRLVKNNVEQAWLEEGNPCLYSSLAVLGGFAIFLSSYFTANRIFGAYMVWSIAIGLFGDLVFFPTILRAFPWVLGEGFLFGKFDDFVENLPFMNRKAKRSQ